MSASLAFGYAAGALSTLSPCVLPILPIVLFGAIERHAWGPAALAAGLAASFAAVGIALASVGFSVGIDPNVLRLVVAALLGAAGVVLLVPAPDDQHMPLEGHGSLLQVGDRENADAAWYYPNPKAAAANIAGKVAFWKGVKIVP